MTFMIPDYCLDFKSFVLFVFQVPVGPAKGVLWRFPEAEAEPGELRCRTQPSTHVHIGPAGIARC